MPSLLHVAWCHTNENIRQGSLSHPLLPSGSTRAVRLPTQLFTVPLDWHQPQAWTPEQRLHSTSQLANALAQNRLAPTQQTHSKRASIFVFLAPFPVPG